MQIVFDDLQSNTEAKCACPHTKDQNTKESIPAMDIWNTHGLLGFTIDLKGGSPYRSSESHPWENNAIDLTAG